MHKVIATIERPTPALIARFKAAMREVVTENVTRAQIMDPAIKPLNGRDWSIVGPAVTVKIESFDHLMSIAALGVAQPGDVIVIAANGHLNSAVWGGGLTLSAKHIGVEAVVVDGAVMDTRAILSREMPVWCRGSYPAHGTWEQPGSVNVPIAAGGVVVNPGDIICGDLDGVIVVPREDAERIIVLCEEKTARLAQVRKELIANKNTLFDRRGGKELIKKAGVAWVD
jgi:4-hydroxy-4-methyl-2-oxoglutarate aldolase